MCTVTSNFLCICKFTTMYNFIHVHSNVKAVPGSSLRVLFTLNTYRRMRRAAVAGCGGYTLLRVTTTHTG